MKCRPVFPAMLILAAALLVPLAIVALIPFGLLGLAVRRC